MDVVQLKSKQITGISIRTSNANEMNPDTAQIGALHQRFDNNVIVDYKSGARVYGVYFNYESDANGEFTVLSGADTIESSKTSLETINLAEGKYLLFKGCGEMPKAVIDTWGEIWHYFSNQETKEERIYNTDFELYNSETEVEIYIGIK